MKEYQSTTIELEYFYSYLSTFFCTRTHTYEKIIDYHSGTRRWKLREIFTWGQADIVRKKEEQ